MRGLTLSIGAALLLAGCVVVDDQLPNDQLSRWPGGGPPPWAPAHGHRAKQAKHAIPFLVLPTLPTLMSEEPKKERSAIYKRFDKTKPFVFEPAEPDPDPVGKSRW